MNKIITTQDGSHSIYSEKFKEAYHSKDGAIQESQHVFIKMGLQYYIEQFNPNSIDIFEMGLGTGLNALLSWQLLKDKNIQLNYTSIEAYPISNWQELNFAKNSEAQTILNKIHSVDWENFHTVDQHFKIKKIKGFLLETEIPKSAFNLVYYDAFAPNAQPELWTQDTFGKVFESLKPNGILTTYCAKGIVKRTLKAVGFQIEALPGPPGKREMTRGLKI